MTGLDKMINQILDEANSSAERFSKMPELPQRRLWTKPGKK